MGTQVAAASLEYQFTAYHARLSRLAIAIDFPLAQFLNCGSRWYFNPDLQRKFVRRTFFFKSIAADIIGTYLVMLVLEIVGWWLSFALCCTKHVFPHLTATTSEGFARSANSLFASPFYSHANPF